MKTHDAAVISPTAASHTEILQSLFAVCEQVERGQGRQPLTEAWRTLGNEGEPAVLRLSVLALGDCAMRSAMTWLGVEADQAGRFAQLHRDAVAQWMVSTLAANDESGPISGVTSPRAFAETKWKQLHVLVAQPDALAGKQAGRFQTFSDHGQLLLVAVQDAACLSERAETTINLLRPCFHYVLPVRFDDGGTPVCWSAAIAATDDAVILPEMNLANVCEPSWLKDVDDPARRALQARAALPPVESLVEAAAARIDRESRYIAESLQLHGEANTPARVKRGRAEEKLGEGLRKLATQRLAEIEERINLENDRLIQPLGGLSLLVRDTANRIREEDLSRQVGHQAIKLRLMSHQVATYNRKLVDALQGQLRADLGKLDGELSSLEAGTQQRFATSFGEATAPRLPRLEFQRVWERVENLVDVGEEAEIELPRRSLFDLMGAGRQKVFFLIMFIALLGRMGIDADVVSGCIPPTVMSWFKAGFMVVLFSTCLGAMFNALILWREEKKEQTRKELERIREALVADAQKTLDQVQKEKRGVLRTYMKDVQEKADAWLDQALEDRLAAEEAEGEKRQLAQRQRREALQERERRLLEAAAAIGRVHEGIRHLQADCDNRVRLTLAGGQPSTPMALAAMPDESPLVSLSTPPAESASASEIPTRGVRNERQDEQRKTADEADAGRVGSKFAQRRAARKQRKSSAATS